MRKVSVLFATIIALVLYFGPPQWDYVGVPGFRLFRIGWLIMPITVLIIVFTSNAVNLTDGLDSLAGASATSPLSATAQSLSAGTSLLDGFCFAVAGSLLAFLGTTPTLPRCLWATSAASARRHARPRGGDDGPMAPAARGGLVFVMEAGSVILQVTYFKWTKRLYGEGRRIFKMSPCTITLNCSAGAKPRSKNVSG